MDDFLSIFGPSLFYSFEEIMVSILMSFVLSMLIAWVYRLTNEGFTSSRSFMQTLVLSGLITSTLIMAIGNNLARGLGILGTLAIVRFRSPIRDPRDIIFLYATLATGIASGAQVFMVAIIGNLSFCSAALLLHFSPFASRRDYEGLLRFTLQKEGDVNEEEIEIRTVMEDYCSGFQLIAVREAMQGEDLEYSYQVRLVDPSYQSELLDKMRKLAKDVNLVMQRSTVEI